MYEIEELSEIKPMLKHYENSTRDTFDSSLVISCVFGGQVVRAIRVFVGEIPGQCAASRIISLASMRNIRPLRNMYFFSVCVPNMSLGIACHGNHNIYDIKSSCFIQLVS